jgi:hypothetical protein
MVLLPRLLIFLVLAAFLSRPANLFAFTSFLFWKITPDRTTPSGCGKKCGES